MKNKEEGKVAGRYARALFESLEQSDFDSVAETLNEFATAWKESLELRNALLNPSFSLEDRVAACRDLLLGANRHDRIGDFLAIVLENNRITAIPQIADAFTALLAAFKNSLSLEITSAFAMDTQEQSEMLEKIKKECGSLVTIDWKVDEKLIGGLVIKAGDTVLDNSILASLASIERTLLQ